MKKDMAVALVKEMVEHGFKLVDETAEEFAERFHHDVDFLREMLEMVKKW